MLRISIAFTLATLIWGPLFYAVSLVALDPNVLQSFILK